MNQDLLQILIPTYNRSSFLKKNILILNDIILKNNLCSIVSIIISDNSSTDNTHDMLNDIKKKIDVNIYINENNENIGLENNALKVLEISSSRFVMYLGDDDYISGEYLLGVIDVLKKGNIGCIIPSFVKIAIDDTPLPGGRDTRLSNHLYRKGKYNAAKLFNKGHQLSGVVLLRNGLLKSYLDNAERNIYLFMYFVGYNIIRSNCYHFTEFPVKVTQPGEMKKDWNYGKDGLVNERFKNSYSLFRKNLIIRFIAEIQLIKKNNSFLLFKYLRKSKKDAIYYINSILNSQYLSFLGKSFFVFFSIYSIMRNKVSKLVKNVK